MSRVQRLNRAPCERLDPVPYALGADLVVIGRLPLAYDAGDFPGFSDDEIRRSLTVPAITGPEGGR